VTRLLEPRTSPWVGILAAIVLGVAFGVVFMVVCKALDHALAVASWCGR